MWLITLVKGRVRLRNFVFEKWIGKKELTPEELEQQIMDQYGKTLLDILFKNYKPQLVSY